jgi:hypothetical protein
MMVERIFSLAGMVVLSCWILLAVAPGWTWTQRVATFVAPLLIACVYVWLLVAHATPKGGGFSSLAQVAVLFSSPYALLAGWIHYLAFDLFTGAWEARDAVRLGISGWVVLPCLALTFLFGPVGLALYLLVKLGMRKSVGAVSEAGVVA